MGVYLQAQKASPNDHPCLALLSKGLDRLEILKGSVHEASGPAGSGYGGHEGEGSRGQYTFVVFQHLVGVLDHRVWGLVGVVVMEHRETTKNGVGSQ